MLVPALGETGERIQGLILGLLMFGEIPDMPTITGTVIIILTGLYSLHRERSVRPTTQEQAHQAKDVEAPSHRGLANQNSSDDAAL